MMGRGMREFTHGSRRRRWVAVLLFGALAALVGGPTGWFVTDALERDNDFCNACHLSEGVPLHRDIRDDFDHSPFVNLAGVHAASRVDARSGKDAAFRCIDCHRGTGLMGRARVKLLAAKDSFWYVTGYFDEPTGMEWPLEDADCGKCHSEFQVKAGEFEAPAFHDLSLHNRGLGVDCVECHLVHRPGELTHYFLDTEHIRAQCARCHSDFLD